MAKKPGINAIIGISDSYDVYQVAGPFRRKNRSAGKGSDRLEVGRDD